MAFAGTKFQRSGGQRTGTNTFYPSRLIVSGSEGWITEDSLVTVAITDSLGLRSRVCRVAISNPNAVNENKYAVMHRVRVVDEFGVVIFTGRVVDVRPDFSRAELHLTCTDYLADISDRTVMADESGGIYSAASRAHIVNQIMYSETYAHPTTRPYVNDGAGTGNVTYQFFKDHLRTLVGRVAVDPSNYIENITSKYANKDHWTRNDVATSTPEGVVDPDTPFDYNYRGIKTGAEAIAELASADTQQDLMAVGWVTSAHVDPDIISRWDDNYPGIPGTSTEEKEYLHTHFPYYWKDFTSEIQEGTSVFIPLFSTSASNKFYLGSNSKFNGVSYGFSQRGATLGSAAYGNFTWEYWNGTNWIEFEPDNDDQFAVSTQGAITGDTNWDYTNLVNWSRRDLGASPELGHVWDASNERDTNAALTGSFNSMGGSNASTIVNGNSIYSDGINHGINTNGYGTEGIAHALVDSTFRYWVRVGTASVPSGGGSRLSYINLYTDRASTTATAKGSKVLVRDYYATDPVFPDVIWEYTNRSGMNQYISHPGGTWVDRGATTSGDVRTLWNDESTSGGATFLPNTDSQWYIGTEQPNTGFELHAVQGKKININSISTNVSNNISIATAGAHGLTTGDKVLLTGTDSEPVIDNAGGSIVNDAGTEVNVAPYVVTVVNATTFTIDISSNISGTLTITSSGSAGTIVSGIPNYGALRWQQFAGYNEGSGSTASNWSDRNLKAHIGSPDLTYASTANYHLADTHWRWDSGADGSIPHWYAEVRFDSNQVWAEISNDGADSTSRNIITDDWSLARVQQHPGLGYRIDGRTSPYTSNFMNGSGVSTTTNGVSDAGSTTRVTTTAAHYIQVGDYVRLSSSSGYSPTLNGFYEVLAINTGGNNFDIRDLGVTGTGTVACTHYTLPPNGKSLYWTKVSYTSLTAPTNPAQLVSIRTANQSHLKYYDRGKEPWKANRGTARSFGSTNSRFNFSGTASSCVHPLKYIAGRDASSNTEMTSGTNRYVSISTLDGAHNNSTTTIATKNTPLDVDGQTGFIVGQSLQIYNPNVDPMTKERVRVTAKASSTSMTVERAQDTLGGGTAAVAHADGSIVSSIVDDTSWYTRIFQSHDFEIVSIIPTTTASTTAAVTVRHNLDPDGNYIVEDFPLISGDVVELDDTDSTPAVDGTYTVRNIRPGPDATTIIFDITHSANVTAAGGAGTCYVYNSTGYPLFPVGQTTNDAIYFGTDEPFTQLRFDLGAAASLTGSADFAVAWEYFADDVWAALPDVFDGTDGFKCAPNSSAEVHWRMPYDWRATQPNKKDGDNQASGNTRDHTQGMHAGQFGFYVRARITTDTGTVGQIFVKKVRYGPSHWNNVTKEVGSLDGVTSTRHTEPLKYGMTLHENSPAGDQNIQMLGYSVGDKPQEFVNKVVVRGQAGAYGEALDQESVDNFNIVREKNFYDTTITTSVAAIQKARTLLATLKPSGIDSSIRECHITTSYWPIYSHQKQPRAVRVGDLVNVTVPTKNLINESWLLASISYDPLGAGCQMVLYRDLDRVVEAGTGTTKLLRDLSARTRELAKASFTTMDTVVDEGINFLPDGPTRLTGRMEFQPIGDMNTVSMSRHNQMPTSGVYSQPDEMRWNFNLFSDFDVNNSDRPQLRIDMTRVRPDQTMSTGGASAESAAQVNGAGLTFIGRRQYRFTHGNTNQKFIAGSGRRDNVADQELNIPFTDDQLYSRDHFHPEFNEATLYLRTNNPDGISTSSTFASDAPGVSFADETEPDDEQAMLGSGLYIAHRGVFDWYGKGSIRSGIVQGARPPLDLHHEVFVGVSGVTRLTNGNGGKKTLSGILPDLKARPNVFLQVDISEDNTNYVGTTAQIDAWTTATEDYNDPTGANTYDRTIFRGFTIALKNADGTAFNKSGAGCNVYYLIVFNSARDGAYYGGPGNTTNANWA